MPYTFSVTCIFVNLGLRTGERKWTEDIYLAPVNGEVSSLPADRTQWLVLAEQFCRCLESGILKITR